MLRRLIVCLTMTGVAAGAAEYYVSPGGDDGAPGTQAKPFATVARARDEVRKHVALGLKEDVTVWLAPGRYAIEEPITFGLEDSGTEEHTITYQADRTDRTDQAPRAIISGGRVITGWKQNGNLWQTTVPAAKDGQWSFRELFVNGKRAQRARHPNSGMLEVQKVLGPDKRTRFSFKVGDFPESADLAGCELVFLHDWSISRVRVESVDMATRTVVCAPVGRDHATKGGWLMDRWEPHPRYFLENARAFLDAPGEWYLDSADGTLTYRPRPGEALGASEIIAPYATALIEIHGDATNNVPVRNLTFRDLAFEHCRFSPTRYVAIQAGMHQQETLRTSMLPPAIDLAVAEHCRFENVRIAHLGASGIYFGSRSKHCALTRSLVTDISGNGVMIGEPVARMLPMPADFQWTCPDKDRKSWWQQTLEHPYRWINKAPEQAATGNVVSDCIIEHIGQQYYGAVGIWIAITKGTTVEYNEIRYAPYSGMSMGWVWDPAPTASSDNLIQNNHIHHVMQKLSDGGGIYTLGRHKNTQLRRNLIHDIPVNTGRSESNGMFLDEGSSELTIEENVIHSVARSPLRFHKATQNLVQRNVLVCGEGVPPIRYNSTKPSEITQEDNIVVGNEKGTPVPGVHGGGMVFDGRKGLDVPHDAALDPEKLTLEAWVKFGQLPTEGDMRRWVAGKNGNEWVDSHYGIGIGGNRVCGFMNIGGGQENAIQVYGKPGEIEPDTWHQLALTYDGLEAVVYCDGKLAGKQAVGKRRRAGRGKFSLAKRPDGYAPIACAMDEVALLNRALTAEEIAMRYEKRGAANDEADESRGGYWGMESKADALKVAIAELMKEAGPRTTGRPR